MNAVSILRGIRTRPGIPSWQLLLLALGGALLGGCEHAFEPIETPVDAPFSMYGYLDLHQDTQWIRVMPVRKTSLAGPEPIDAVVTLEQVGSGRIVTLTDSLVRFAVLEVDGVAYAHNFWTAEPLEPGVTYRLTATRSDGAATTATVAMPPEPAIDYMSGPHFGKDNALLRVHGERLLFVDMFYVLVVDSTRERADPLTIPQHVFSPGNLPGTFEVPISGGKLEIEHRIDVLRREIRVIVGTADWPFHPDMSDLEVSLPGRVPTNVTNGVGFVGGIAQWTMPLVNCRVLEVRPGGEEYCVHRFDRNAASVHGRILRECGQPQTFADVRLTERYAGGGALARTWLTGWEGEFRFDGIEPGAQLVLDLGPGEPEVPLPPLLPGQRLDVGDITSLGRC